MLGSRVTALFVLALLSACSGDDGSGSPVDSASTPPDTSGACGILCGGDLACPFETFDPADGLDACTRACQAEWPHEQDAACIGRADFVLECVDANGSCNTLDEATCGYWLDDLVGCAVDGPATE